jgi:hypothetical protein
MSTDQPTQPAMAAARELYPKWAEDEATLVLASDHLHYYARIIDKHFSTLRAELAAAKALADENEELAEIGTALTQLVEANTLECDVSFEPDDVLAAHYKELTQLRADLAAKGECVQKLADKPMLVDVAASAIWEQHMNKLAPEDRTEWNDTPALGRGITLAYAKNALLAVDSALSANAANKGEK